MGRTAKVLTRSERHDRQARMVLLYAYMTDFPAIVLDQISRLRRDIPVVFVLYYGGTIGMRPVLEMREFKQKFERKVYEPEPNAEKLLQPLKYKGLELLVQVVWIPVYEDKAIDSTNGRWTDWVTIGNAVRRLHTIMDRFATMGIVVCGGTDTMAHMLAAMGFMFPNIGIPIVGAGSQVPMGEIGDDATNNLFFSIVAAVSDLSGIHLFFDKRLMDGRYVHKVKDRQRDAFDCPPEFVYGVLEDTLVIFQQAPPRHQWITFDRLVFNPQFREGLKIHKISPATPSEEIMHDAASPICCTMLMITFGSGNVRNEGIIRAEQTHVRCLWELYRRKYAVTLASGMMDGRIESAYLGGALAVSREKGGGNAISAGPVTGPLIEVKCMVGIAHAWDETQDSINYGRYREVIETDLIGELSRNRIRGRAAI